MSDSGAAAAAEADLQVSADGNVRVDDKGNWHTAQRVSSMISLFGGSVKRKPPPPKVLDVKVGAGGQIQMTPAVTPGEGNGVAGVSASGVSLPTLRYSLVRLFLIVIDHSFRFFNELQL